MRGGARLAAPLLLLLAAALPPAPSHASPRVSGLKQADSLAIVDAPGRERALADWSRGAALAELMFVLRHGSRLKALEAALARRALERTPRSRPALRRHLALRLATLDPRRSGGLWKELGTVPERFPAAPRASVFRAGVLLPDSGSYAAEARALRLGLAAGLAAGPGDLPIEVFAVSTGDDHPARLAAAFDRAAAVGGALVGGTDDHATAVLAALARAADRTLISPVAGDERLGELGAVQVGPSGVQRGRMLARTVLAPGPRRIGLLLAAGDTPLARGFVAAAESLRATVAWRAEAVPAADLRAAARALAAADVELLFWDGPAGDAAALVRALAQEKVQVAVCGGAELDPTRHHAPLRAALEGATWAGEEWRLEGAAREALERAARQAGEPLGGSPAAWAVRGWLAGRLIAVAVAGGALCPEELRAAIDARRSSDPWLGARGFVDWDPREAACEVFVTTRGALRPGAGQ